MRIFFVGKNANSADSLARRMAENTSRRGPWSKLCGSRCHVWTGGKDTNGYGRISVEGKRVGAHRAAFWLANGYWPTECRHRCDNKACVRGDHLLDGDRSLNMQDAVERGLWSNQNINKEECDHGHAFTEENTGRDRRGHRYCRECKRTEARERYRRNHPGVKVRV